MKWIYLPITILIFFVVTDRQVIANEAAYEPRESIMTAARTFVESEIGSDDARIEVRKIDNRLRLAACAQDLIVRWAPGARQVGASSVSVACEGSKPWKLYVRVNIEVMRQVAVAARPLVRGQVFQASDIRYEQRNIARLGRDYVTQADDWVGYEITQSVNPGALLKSRMFKAPKLIKRGQKVILRAVAAGIEVKMAGEALADGGKGAVIRVRNLRSKKVVQGEVVGKGVVNVLM